MTTKPQTFTLSLKVAGESVKLSIECDQTIDEVFQKLRRVYPKSINKKAEIIEKLKDSLQSELEMRRINPSLLQSIEYFLLRSFPSNNSRSHNILESSKIVNLVESNTQYCESQKSNNNHKITQNSITTKNNLPSNPPQSIQPNQNNPITIDNRPRLSLPSKRSKCNPDVIKACKTIMKKVQNNEMKHMAKQFLKRKGYLKQEKEKSMNLQKHKTNDRTKTIITQIQQQAQPANNVKFKCITQHSQVSSELPINVLNKLSQNNGTRTNTRANRYNYLQSSLANDSILTKECQLSKDYESPSIINQIVPSKPKKYSYLQ